MNSKHKAVLDLIKQEKNDLSIRYIKKYPNKIMSLIVLTDIAGFSPSVGQIKPIFDILATDLKNSPRGKRLSDLLASFSKTRVGDMTLDFTMNDMVGNPVRLSWAQVSDLQYWNNAIASKWC